MTTITYNKLEHTYAIEKQYNLAINMAYLGVVDRRVQTKVRFVAFVALFKQFQAKLHHFVPSCWALAKTPNCRDMAILCGQ